MICTIVCRDYDDADVRVTTSTQGRERVYPQPQAQHPRTINQRAFLLRRCVASPSQEVSDLPDKID